MQQEDLSRQTPEEIRRQMAETYAALTDKVNALQDKVEEAKDMVSERIEQAKKTLSLSYLVVRSPWYAMAAAVATGIVLRKIVSNRKSAQENHHVSFSPPRENLKDYDTYSLSSLNQPSIIPAPTQSAFSRLTSKFGDEINHTKKIAVGSGIGLLREFAKSNLPPALGPHIDKLAARASKYQDAKLYTSSNL